MVTWHEVSIHLRINTPELGLVRVRGLVQIHVASKRHARLLEGRHKLDNGIALVAWSSGLEVAIRVVGVVVPALDVLVPACLET